MIVIIMHVPDMLVWQTLLVLMYILYLSFFLRRGGGATSEAIVNFSISEEKNQKQIPFLSTFLLQINIDFETLGAYS